MAVGNLSFASFSRTTYSFVFLFAIVISERASFHCSDIFCILRMKASRLQISFGRDVLTHVTSSRCHSFCR